MFASGQREQSHPLVSLGVILAIPDNDNIITYFTNGLRDINTDIFRSVLTLLHPRCLANLQRRIFIEEMSSQEEMETQPVRLSPPR